MITRQSKALPVLLFAASLVTACRSPSSASAAAVAVRLDRVDEGEVQEYRIHAHPDLVFVQVPASGSRNGFLVSRYEVTFAQLSLFLAATRGAAMSTSDAPADAVGLELARDYCRWIGGSLPTADEWRGIQGPGTSFPWGTTGHDNGVLEWCEDDDLWLADRGIIGWGELLSGWNPMYYLEIRSGFRPVLRDYVIQ